MLRVAPNGILLGVCLLVTCCGSSDSGGEPLPAYTGPMPGARAQFILGELVGRTFVDRDNVFGGGEWTVDTFAVRENPTSLNGPVILLRQGSSERFVPIECDGDASELWFRVTGERSNVVSGATSDAYRTTLKLKP